MTVTETSRRHVRASRGQRRICTVNGCESVVVGRGYCTRHYQRWQKHGDPEAPRFEYWPERDRARLAELLDIGWSDQRIARDLGRSVSTIKKARLRFGMAPRYRRGHTAREVARIVGVHHMTPQRWIDSGRLPVRYDKAHYGRFRCLMVDHFDLCEFLANPDNWHCYTPGTITDPALRAWLTRLRGDVRFLTVKEAALRLGIGYTSVRARAEKRGVDLPKDGGIVWVRESDLVVLAQPLRIRRRAA